MKNEHTFSAEILRESSKSFLIKTTLIEADPIGYGYIETPHTCWIPKSLTTRTEDGRFSVPNWLARNEGLIQGQNRGLFRYREAF